MDSFEWNKYAMAFLGTVFAVFGLGIVSEAIFHEEVPEQQAFVISENAGAEREGAGEAAGPAYEPVAPLLASADVGAGETVFKKCAACHTIENGGPNRVGPNLWGVVNRNIASHEGFSYSSAMKAYGEGKTWTYDELNGFIWKPKTHIKGTAMGFAGLSKVEDRANLIAYMRTQSDNPAPLPDAATAEAPAADAAATEAPSTGAPATETPATDAPASENPAADAPATEKPADSEQSN